jgi:hypothetical protein
MKVYDRGKRVMKSESSDVQRTIGKFYGLNQKWAVKLFSFVLLFMIWGWAVIIQVIQASKTNVWCTRRGCFNMTPEEIRKSITLDIFSNCLLFLVVSFGLVWWMMYEINRKSKDEKKYLESPSKYYKNSIETLYQAIKDRDQNKAYESFSDLTSLLNIKAGWTFGWTEARISYVRWRHLIDKFIEILNIYKLLEPTKREMSLEQISMIQKELEILKPSMQPDITKLQDLFPIVGAIVLLYLVIFLSVFPSILRLKKSIKIGETVKTNEMRAKKQENNEGKKGESAFEKNSNEIPLQIKNPNALKAYKSNYLPKNEHKAFAYAPNGAYGYCTNKPTQSDAEKCAMTYSISERGCRVM